MLKSLTFKSPKRKTSDAILVINPGYGSLFNSTAILLGITPQLLTIPVPASRFLASSTFLIILLLFILLSLFFAIAFVIFLKCSLFNSTANLLAITPRLLTIPDTASSILASSNVLIMLIAFMILSLFAAIASVTSAKLSCLICSSDFCMRLIFVILSAIIYSPDFLGKCNHHVSICLQHVRYTVVVFV